MTSLDYLVMTVACLAAAGLLGIFLMFLSKNETIKRISFYAASALGIYLGYVGVRIMWLNSMSQTILAVWMALISVGALGLVCVKGKNKKVFQIARTMSSLAVVVGMVNAFS